MFHWYIDFYVPVGIVVDVVADADVTTRPHEIRNVVDTRDRRKYHNLLYIDYIVIKSDDFLV